MLFGVKKAFVTGASGFIGSAVVRELLRDGVEVRVLMRRGSDHRTIEGLDVEVIEGDLLDAGAIAKGTVGADACFHVAGMNTLWLRGRRDIKNIYDANERGAAMVLRTAAEAGCGAIVHCSSVVAVGRPGEERHAHEDDHHGHEDALTIHYARSKYLGEKKAKELAEGGAPITIVNPSAPMGPWDVKPTPTGRVVLDFLKRRMPGYMETGLNIIDVQDCARGHILAAQKGRRGERYILGHENLSIAEIFRLLSELSGIPEPRFKVPRAVGLMTGFFSELKSRATGRAPNVPLAGVRMALKPMFYDNRKAREELGLPTRPVRETLRRAAAWFIEHEYVEAPPKDVGQWNEPA